MTEQPVKPRPAQADGWDRDLRLPEAAHIGKTAGIVEINLEAKIAEIEVVPGTRTRAWTYNGLLPGPLIRAKVGDRLIVNFTNHLPEETTVHWHGIRLPAAMDGVPVHSQKPVMPNGTFKYEFVLPDAGLFWYHPHVRSAGQVGDGLYGALMVEDPGEPAGLGDEVVMVLSDMSLDDAGTLLPADIGGEFGVLFGREGTYILVNGKVMPELRVVPGRRQRWRIVNAARTRYFRLDIAGQTFQRIGGDGGLLEAPVEQPYLVVTPGERLDVLIAPRGDVGSSVPMRWVAYDRGFGTTFMRPDVDMMTLKFVDGTAGVDSAVPAKLRTIAPLDITSARTQELRLTRATVKGRVVMGINGVPGAMAPPMKIKVGETQIWNVVNDVEFAHPFHLHGFFFQVLSWADAGDKLRPPPPLEWKDTADVPVKGRLTLAVRFEDRPGMWMFHCHILDHAEAGMMGMVQLDP